MNVRRVVTGHSAAGKSVIVSDELVAATTVAMMPGAEFHRIWGGDTVPELPVDGSHPPAHGWFPTSTGFRFGFATLPPAGDADAEPAGDADQDVDAMAAEVNEKLPGLLEVFEPDEPGMHITDSIDYLYVVSGEVSLEVDDGVLVPLKPGDCVVQNGTRHRWVNTGEVPVVLAIALVGCERAS
jgi:mannose-6-phosphate isomerase-like protein (cupin superfamily)